MPTVPDSLKQQLSIKQIDNTIQIETPSELSPVLKWLADAPLADVMIQPVGLRAIYDKFHHESTNRIQD